MNDAQLLQLLSLCRNELQITWEDNDTDDRIKNHIQNGITYLSRVTGAADTDYNAGGKANALLLAYVRRAISGDISTFEADYLSDIIALQIDSEVESYENEE